MAQNQSADRSTDELTEFQYTLLFLLANGAAYGLAVKRSLQEYYGGEINHGRLYPNLDTLAERELVTKTKFDARTNKYALTDRGLNRLLEHVGWEITQLVEDAAAAQSLVGDLEGEVIPERD